MVQKKTMNGSSDFTYDERISKLTFGSCHKTKYADRQIWKTIANEKSDAFLWTGDSVYPPVRGVASSMMMNIEFNLMHETESIGYSEFLDTGVQVFGTWDDHDFGGNDEGNGMPDKERRANAYWRFLRKDRPDWSRKGLYYSVQWGEPQSSVKAIFLDTRWHRQEHCIPSVATKFPLGAGVSCLFRWLSAGLFPKLCREGDDAILGSDQWDWLQKQLNVAPQPRVLVIISSIQVLTTNPAMESWGHFPKERGRLIQLLLRQTGSSVVLLSGDVHHGEILDPLPDIPHSPFLEVTSSGLTHDCQKHIYGKLCKPLLEVYHGHRFKGNSSHTEPNYYIGRNYGTIAVDWESNTVEVKVHNVSNGETVLTTGARTLHSANTYSIYSGYDMQLVRPCMDGHLIPYALAALAALALLTLFVLKRKTSGIKKHKNS